MRKLVLVALFVVACGGSSKSGGGGVSGTVGGKAFTPTEVRALVVNTGSSPCSLPNPGGGGSISFGVAALAIEFTSYANACGDLTPGQCTVHANAQNVTVLHARLDGTGAAPVLVPGTFTIHPDPATVTPDLATGNFLVAFAQAVTTGATCTPSASPSAEGGQLTISSVSATQVKGHVNVTFSGGGNLEGDFTADVCAGAAPDICALASASNGGGLALCQTAPTCVP